MSQYPAYSHAFIESEVNALRRSGWDVRTFSIRAPGIANHVDNATTVSIGASRRAAVILTCLAFSLRHPGALASVAARLFGYAAGRGNTAKRLLWQFFYLGEAIFLQRKMAEQQVHHVHVHFANNAADVARLVVDIGNKVNRSGDRWTWSMTVHGPTDLRDARVLGLKGKVASAEFVTCISDFCVEAVRAQSAPEHWSKITVVRMGIDGTQLPPLREPARVGDAPSAMNLLFVGRLVPQKGLDVLMGALKKIPAPTDAGTDAVVRAVIIGDGPLRSALERESEQLSPHVDLRLLGARDHDEVLTWYEWADVFVLPSYSEGLPVVLMEALGAGVPAITTPVAGIPELVRPGVSGLLVPPGDSDALVATLDRLWKDAELRARLGRGGRTVVSEHYQSDVNVQTLAALFVDASLRR